MRTQSKNKQTAEGREDAADQLVIGDSLAFDWLTEWCEFSEQSQIELRRKTNEIANYF